MSKSILVQITEQGFVIQNEEKMWNYWGAMQRNKDAINSLHIIGVITDTEYTKICQRFVSEISQYVEVAVVKKEPDEPHCYCIQCGNDDMSKLSCIGTWASGTEYRCEICKHTFQFRHPKES